VCVERERGRERDRELLILCMCVCVCVCVCVLCESVCVHGFMIVHTARERRGDKRRDKRGGGSGVFEGVLFFLFALAPPALEGYSSRSDSIHTYILDPHTHTSNIQGTIYAHIVDTCCSPYKIPSNLSLSPAPPPPPAPLLTQYTRGSRSPEDFA
jgi:hypothetical protein